MHEYCLAYKCESEPGNDVEDTTDDLNVWKVVAQACVCFENELWQIAKSQLKHYDSLFTSIDKDNLPLTSLKRYRY